MGTNPISIQITDGVAATIQPKIEGIATASRDASTGITGLQQALNNVSIGNLSNLSSTIRSISTASNTLTKATAAMGNAASQASGQINQLSDAYATLALRMAVALSTLQAFTAAAASANSGILSFNATVGNTAGAVSNAGLSTFQTSAALKVLDGNTMGATLAAAGLIRQSALMSGVLAAAFPVIGAVALLAILGQMFSAVQNLIKAYKDLTVGIREAQDAQILQGNKTLTVSPQGSIATTIAKTLTGDYQSEQDIQIKNVQYSIQQLTYAKELADAQAANNEKALQGGALAAQKVKDDQAQIAITQQMITKVETLGEEYQSMLEKSHTVSQYIPGNPYSPGSGVTSTTQVHDINDPAQVKALQSALTTVVSTTAEWNHQVDMLNVKLSGDKLKEPIADAKDEAKAAVAQMKLFADQMASLESYGGVVTPQMKLDLLQRQQGGEMGSVYPQNNLKLDQEEGTQNQVIAKTTQDRTKDITDLIQKYQDAAENVGLYSNALKEQNLWDKASLQMSKDKLQPTQEETAALKDAIQQSVESGTYQQQLNTIYKEANEPLLVYQASLRAAGKLFQDGAITQQQFTQAVTLSTRQFQNATNPLNEYGKGIQNQIELWGTYGNALTVATQVQNVQQQLAQKGLTLNSQIVNDLVEQTSARRNLTAEEQKGQVLLTQYLTQINNQKIVESDINTLEQQNAGAVELNTLKQTALGQALAKNIITYRQYAQSILQLNVAMSQLNINQGKGTLSDTYIVSLGTALDKLQTQLKSLSLVLTDDLGKAWNSFGDGAAEAFGRAATGQETLSQAMTQMAQQVIGQLIASFIKLGIQMLEEIVLATVLKSLLGFGSALGGGAGAFNTMMQPAGFSTALSQGGLVKGYADGGVIGDGGLLHGPGTGLSDSIPVMASDGEYIMDAANTSRNLPSLLRMSQGGNASSPMSVHVVHDGSTAIQVQALDEGRIRVIARQEATNMVNTKSASVVAGAITNPNSRLSKTQTRYTTVSRRRV